MNEILFLLILGHLFGDYLLQSYCLAVNKKKYSLIGWSSATYHCLIYTTTIYGFLLIEGIKLNFIQCLLIFLSHFIIDKFPVIEYYMKVMDIRSWDRELPKTGNGVDFENKEPITIIQLVTTSFGSFVYIMCDNTFHLFFMYLILKFSIGV